ncbi:MAG: sigma-70 family RNA polymerase sigma factor [Clostridia bacterium]|nr:sigma-70 family RNA polymerase sigma factor [Clostridia bacterium]
MQSRIAGMSRAIRSWCIARTPTIEDAEDLAQDILLEMLQALPNLREPEAFYGFMWTVAGNVYRQWCRKRARHPETLPKEASAAFAWPEELPEEVYLLRRELSLLTRRYRQSAVLYYIDGLSVREIAEQLKVTQSMVKYLLFRTRIKLKEGMSMERNVGMQSYQPKQLDLRYWGHATNRYSGAADTLVRQNILFACYNDELTAEEVSLAIGVALPYIEDDLNTLEGYGLLVREGKRYRTNLIIFTDEFHKDVERRAQEGRRRIAELVKRCIAEKGAGWRSLGFVRADMNDAAFVWHASTILLYQAVIEKVQGSIRLELPLDKFGVPCMIWGVEEQGAAWVRDFAFGACQMDNETGDRVQFMDFPINGEMAHWRFSRNQAYAFVFLDIARGCTAHLSDNDRTLAADMVRQGYVHSADGSLSVRCPVYTSSQYDALRALIDPETDAIAEAARQLLDTVTQVLDEHVPSHLRKNASRAAYFRLFEEGISAPMALLWAERFLPDASAADVMPTTYVRLCDQRV